LTHIAMHIWIATLVDLFVSTGNASVTFAALTALLDDDVNNTSYDQEEWNAETDADDEDDLEWDLLNRRSSKAHRYSPKAKHRIFIYIHLSRKYTECVHFINTECLIVGYWQTGSFGIYPTKMCTARHSDTTVRSTETQSFTSIPLFKNNVIHLSH